MPSKDRQRIRSLRITEKNKINNWIKENQGFINTNKRTINRFKTQDSIDTSRIDKLLDKNEELLNKVKELQKRYEDVDKGLLDDELQESVNKVNNEIRRKNEEKLIKKNIVKEQLDKQKVISKKYYQSQITSGNNERNMNNSEKYFNKVCDNLPDYLLKKLKNMPENKGYIFRGIYFYGYKKVPAHKRTSRILFENNRKRFFIHEWNDKTGLYTKHEKIDNKNVLIEEKPKSLINTNNKNISIL